MREITLTDLTVAARILCGLVPADRRSEMERALDRAHAADLFRKRFGRVHPLLGNGTLAGAFTICKRLPDEPKLQPAFLFALDTAIHVVLEWRYRQNIKSCR